MLGRGIAWMLGFGLSALCTLACPRAPYVLDAGQAPDGGDPRDAATLVSDAGPPSELDSGVAPGPDVAPPPPPPVEPGPAPVDAGTEVDAGSSGHAGVPGVPVRVGFTNDPIRIEADECSGSYPEVPRLRVAILDGPGEEVTVDEDVVITLNSNSGTLRFYTDTTCMQNVGQITLSAGTRFKTLTVLDSEPGTPEIIANAADYERGTHTIEVTAP